MDSLIASLRGWTPVHVAAAESRVDWAVMRGAPTRPFFEEDADLAMRRPFNRVFARRTSLDALDALADAPDIREPAGIIAHISRCGSTLVAQMLATLPSLTVLAEAQPFDALVRRHYAGAACEPARLLRAMRGLVRAFDRGDGSAIVVKLHAWHALTLPLYRTAFPRTPVVVVFREPSAVLQSQERRPGFELNPGGIPASVLPIGDVDETDLSDYRARVIAALCGAALEQPPGETTFVDYAELPDAVIDRIAPRFGLRPTTEDRDAMRAVANLDMKRGVFDGGVPRGPAFAADDAAPGVAIQRHARRLLDEPYAALRERARERPA